MDRRKIAGYGLMCLGVGMIVGWGLYFTMFLCGMGTGLCDIYMPMWEVILITVMVVGVGTVIGCYGESLVKGREKVWRVRYLVINRDVVWWKAVLFWFMYYASVGFSVIGWVMLITLGIWFEEGTLSPNWWVSAMIGAAYYVLGVISMIMIMKRVWKARKMGCK